MSSTFLETPRFPMTLAYGTSGGPQYYTTKVESESGFEQRNIHWEYPRHTYNAAGGVKKYEQLEEVISFFHAVKGEGYGFRFKDVLDFKSCAVQSSTTSTDQAIGTGNASQTTFQLIKTYTQGSMSTERKIKKPVSGTVKIALNGVTQPSGWTVNTSTGLITFSAAPGAGVAVTAGYEFDVPVRFDVGALNISVEALNMGTLNIPIKEIKI